MHIPDGFLAPAVYAPLLALQGALVYYALDKTRRVVSDINVMPLLASFSAFSFVIMMFNVPIPGGTSGHATGIGVLSILFGPWVAFFSLSATLALQALLFGDGGVLAFGANALCLGFLGAFTASFSRRFAILFVSEKAANFIAGYLATIASSIGVALLLGVQPLFFVDSTGKPEYFPLGLEITAPAIVGSHALFFGILEGAVTLGALSLLKRANINISEAKA